MASAAGAIAGIGIGAALGGAVKAASNLNETVNKTNVIFGQNASEVRAWSQDSARSFGLSQQAALEAASSFGNMLTQLGYTGDAALQASTSTVKLAADLGSFNNLDTEDVLDRIGAAMRGEYDSLQLLIPNINAARVQTEAMAATGKTNAAALTAQEKAAATLAIVTRDGAAAQDDFAETSDGLANSQKILNAEWQDAQARLGSLLIGPVTGIVKALTNGVIPAFEGAVEIVGDAIEMFADLPGPVQAALGVMGGFALLRGPLSGAFDTIALKALYARDAIGAAATSVGGLKSALGSLASTAATLATITVLAKAIGDVIDFTQAGDDARTMVESLNDSLEGLEGPARIEANRDAIRKLRNELEDYQAILDQYEDQGWFEYTFWGQFFGPDGDEIVDAKDAIETLQAAIESLESGGDSALGTLGPLGDSLGWLGDQATVAGEETAAAAAAAEEASQDWLDALQNISEGFVEPLSVYKDLLGQKQAAERESAEATAAATASGEDSWEDYAANVQVSLQEYAAALMEQITAQENWRSNLVAISQRGGTEVAQILAEMGVEGAGLTAQMAAATEEDFRAMRDALIREAELSGEGATDALASELSVMALIGRDGSARTVQEVARQLGLGVGVVREIARKYGVELAAGVNPLLRGLGKPGIDISGAINSGGGRAMGGFITGPGGPTDDRAGLFALSDGEYVVRAASVAKYGRQLFEDLNVGRLATGGYVTAGDVPRPYSTAPYRWPITPPADASMQKGFDEVRAWLSANTEAVFGGGAAGRGSVGGSWTSIWNLVKAAIPLARINSTFRPGDPGYHGRNKAIDFGYGSGPGGLGSAGLAAINRFLYDSVGGSLAELIYDGYGDDRPDLKNGRPLTYSASTRAQHRNHVHAAVYDEGGWLPPGLTLAYNGTGRAETVRTAADEAALHGPIDLSEATIDRLAVAMMRGAGAAVGARESAQARALSSRPR